MQTAEKTSYKEKWQLASSWRRWGLQGKEAVETRGWSVLNANQMTPERVTKEKRQPEALGP